MYIVTTDQMQAAEKETDASGFSYDQMMEQAGQAVAKAIASQFDVTGTKILVLVGPGNNGGDGLVAARYLDQMEAIVTVYVWKRDTEMDKNWLLLEGTNAKKIISSDGSIPTQLAHLLNETEIIVDSLLGTGVSRPIEGTLAELLEQTQAVIEARRSIREDELLLVDPTQPALLEDDLNKSVPFIVAVDVPSGLNSDTGHVDPYTLPANMTVTMAAVKQGHLLIPGPEVVGQLIVADIGIAPNHYPSEVTLEMATATKIAEMLPLRPAGAHKGTFGTALIIAGSINYTGAAILAAQAANRIGTGLVTLATPQTVHPILASQLVEATYLPLVDENGAIAADASSQIIDNLGRASALLIGPGLGQADSTVAFLQDLLSNADSLPPLILDADALNILSRQEDWWQQLPPNCILTPHPGEMSRLMDTTVQSVLDSRLKIAGEMAARWNQIVLLKGAHTIVAAPGGRTMVMPFANPALAKAGSGDVLAGTIAGLRAQGLDAFEATVVGAYLHGVAGEIARDQLGATSAVAGDLIYFLPTAIQIVWED